MNYLKETVDWNEQPLNDAAEQELHNQPHHKTQQFDGTQLINSCL